MSQRLLILAEYKDDFEELEDLILAVPKLTFEQVHADADPMEMDPDTVYEPDLARASVVLIMLILGAGVLCALVVGHEIIRWILGW